MSESNNKHQNLTNEQADKSSPKKPSRLKTAVDKAIAKLWITLSVIGGNGAFNALSLGTASAIVAACEKDDTGPKIIKEMKEITISGGEIFTITGNQVKIGNTVIQEFQDDVSKTNVTISSSFDGSPKSSGSSVDKSGVVTSIARDEVGNPSRTATTQITKKETTEKPEFSWHIPEITISKGDTITQSGKEIFAGTQKIFAWDRDDYTFSINIKLPYTVNNDIDIKFSLSIKGGQPQTRTTKITAKEADNNEAPKIKREKTEANIFGGVKLTMENNQFSLGDVLYATGTDDRTQNLTMSFEVDGHSYKSGDIISVANDGKKHTGKLTYTDEKEKNESGEIHLENDVTKAINGRENINSLNLKVGQETNLLGNVKFNDAELKKLEIQVNNGQWHEISEPYRYTPTNTGTIVVRLTIQGPMGNTAPRTSNTLTIEKAPTIEYHAMPIENLDPYRILSNLGIEQIKQGDLNVYEYIKPLGIAEGMRMRKMMGKHGAGGYTAKEYSEYTSRTNLVMLREIPDSDKYTNFERIGENVEQSGSEEQHPNNEQGILTEFAGEYANLKVVGVPSPSNPEKNQFDLLYEYAQNHPNSMFIVCCSASPAIYSKESYDKQKWKQQIVELCNLKNVTVIFAGGDTRIKNGVKIYKVFNGIYESTSDGIHIYASAANSDQNNFPNSHALVNTGTNPTGHADITNRSGSLFPVGFDEDVLFAGFAFPYFNRDRLCFYGDPVPNGSWDASYGAYINGGVLGLEFDLHADMEDMDQLLSMARSSSIENSITLNGDTQKLQRLNVAEYIRQYNMTLDVPKKIKPGETIMLTKGYYKGTIYEGPGVEVYIKGKGWIANTKENESIIKAEDPFELDTRRINGGGLSQYGILPGNTFQITERTVDDQWNGTTISKDFSVTVEQ